MAALAIGSGQPVKGLQENFNKKPPLDETSTKVQTIALEELASKKVRSYNANPGSDPIFSLLFSFTMLAAMIMALWMTRENS